MKINMNIAKIPLMGGDNMKKSLAINFILFISLFCIEWQPAGPGGGGAMFVPAVSPHNPNLMFISCDMGGVYRSTDGGTSWHMINFRQLKNSIACPPVFHPVDSLTMWDDCYRNWRYYINISTDGGETWDSVWRSPRKILALHCLRDTPLCVLASVLDSGIYRSVDGISFALTYRVKNVFKFDENDSGVFACSETLLLRSTDRGVSFSNIPLPAGITASNEIVDIAASGEKLFVLSPSTLWCSSDCGISWRTCINSSSYERGNFRFVRAAGNFVWVTTDNSGRKQPTALLSTDGGITFSEVFFCNSSWGDVPNLAHGWISLDYSCGWGGAAIGFTICRTNPKIALWTDMGRALATFSAGTSWAAVYTEFADTGSRRDGAKWRSVGLEVTTSWDLYISKTRPGRMRIAYTDISGAISDDGGATWQIAFEGIPTTWRNTNYYLEYDSTTGILWGAFSGLHDIKGGWSANFWNRSGHGGVAYSTDQGKSWIALHGGLPDKPVTSIAIDYTSPPTARRIYAAVWSDGIWRSTDGGRTWERCSRGLDCGSGTSTAHGPNTHMVEVKVHPTGTVFALKTKYIRPDYIIKNDGGLWKSTDGGDNWECISTNVADCPPVSWIDSAGEHSWADPISFVLDPLDVDHIWVCAQNCNNGKVQGGLYETTDGGRNWTRILRIYGALTLTKSIYYPNTFYLGTAGNGIMISTDGGVTWSEITNFPFETVTKITEDPFDSNVIWTNTFGGGVWKGYIHGTGIMDKNKEYDNTRCTISIYPNPFNNAISILADYDATIRIITINGRTVYSGKITKKSRFIWYPRELNSGIYILEASAGNSKIYRKVLYIK